MCLPELPWILDTEKVSPQDETQDTPELETVPQDTVQAMLNREFCLKWTDSSRVYALTNKFNSGMLWDEDWNGIKCHRRRLGKRARKRVMAGSPDRSWKRHRKTQYKIE